MRLNSSEMKKKRLNLEDFCSAAIVETLERRVLLNGVTFASPVTYAVATSDVFPIRAADVNGDGFQDIVSDNYGSVSVLLGNGNGTLQSGRTFSDGLSSSGAHGVDDMTIADLGNGHPDILISNGYSGDVSVLLGNGNGTFQSPTLVLASNTSDVDEIAVGDLGDGHADLVTANYDGTVSVLLGNGNGTFQPPQSITVGGTLKKVALADINGDGIPDIVLGDSTTGTVIVLLGNGNGTFGSPETIAAAGTDVNKAYVADLNGHTDLIVANKDGTVDVVLGNGDGTFQSAVQVYSGGSSSVGVVVADLNGDGNPDLGTSGGSLLLGNGNGTFQSAIAVSFGASSYVNADAEPDLTGDGEADLVYGYNNSAKIAVRLNTTPLSTPTITQTGNTVTGTGTAQADTASVDVSGSKVIVTIDGTSDLMPTSSVTGLVLDLGAGNDSVNIGADVPPITVGGAGGNDSIVANNSGDSLRGGRGNDVIVADGTSDSAVGGGGNDTLATSGATGQQLFGGPGDDLFINANGSGDLVDGGPGLNFAQVNSGDTLSGILETYDPNPLDVQPALDTVPDSAGGDDLQVFGTSGNDSITLSDDGMGNLVIVENGGTSQDYPKAGITGVLLAGGLGDDTLVAETSVLLPITLRGAKGNDSLVGGGGNNVIVGGSGNDTLQGGDGTNDLAPGRRVTFEDSPSGNDMLIGGPAGSQNFADFAYRTDNLYLINNGLPDSGDTAEGESTTIMPNVQNIFAGAGHDTVLSVIAGSFISSGVGKDSLSSGGANTTLVAGPPGAGEDTVIANSFSANALYLQNGHADEYQGEIIGDILQTDTSDAIL